LNIERETDRIRARSRPSPLEIEGQDVPLYLVDVGGPPGATLTIDVEREILDGGPLLGPTRFGFTQKIALLSVSFDTLGNGGLSGRY
jgi:hypothetical protein